MGSLLQQGLIHPTKAMANEANILRLTCFMMYLVLCSTRISNELGAGKAQGARAVVLVVLILSIAEATIVTTILFFCRHIFGYAFRRDGQVVDYVGELASLLCLSLILDGLHGMLSGIARGCGWQRIGAFINLGAYYLAGAPVTVLLGIVAHLHGKGLRIGILTGSALQSALLGVITALTNWQKQANNARQRMFDEAAISSENQSQLEVATRVQGNGKTRYATLVLCHLVQKEEER